MLWLGNSLTYTYDIPSQVTDLAASFGVPMVQTTYAPGGWCLIDHATNVTSLGYLDSGQFDLVVLQEQSQVPSIAYYRDVWMEPGAQLSTRTPGLTARARSSAITGALSTGNGVFITGAGAKPSPSVKLGHGRHGGGDQSLPRALRHQCGAGRSGPPLCQARRLVAVQGDLILGEAGTGWVWQTGGSLSVQGTLTLGQLGSGAGHYALNGGSLTATRIIRGAGSADFSFTNGALAFSQFGASTQRLDLAQSGGTLQFTNTPATVMLFGNYTQAPGVDPANRVGGRRDGPEPAAGERDARRQPRADRAPGLTLQPGSQFALLSATAVTGTFASVTFPGDRLGRHETRPLLFLECRPRDRQPGHH